MFRKQRRRLKERESLAFRQFEVLRFIAVYRELKVPPLVSLPTHVGKVEDKIMHRLDVPDIQSQFFKKFTLKCFPVAFAVIDGPTK